MSARCDQVITRLTTATGDVAVFAHGHLLRALIARWLDLDISMGRAFALSTASVCMLGNDLTARAIEL